MKTIKPMQMPPTEYFDKATPEELKLMSTKLFDIVKMCDIMIEYKKLQKR